MLALFRTNQFISNILLIFYVLVLRGMVFFIPADDVSMSQPGILSQVVYDSIGTLGWLPDLIALLLVLIQALLVNVIVAKYRMARSVSLYPGVFYILLASSFPDFLHLSPLLMANTFLLFAIYDLFDTYKKYSAAGELYNIGLWLGIGALFYYSTFVFLIAAVVGFTIVRSFKLKELMMVLLGLISPFWLLVVWYAFTGQYSSLFWDQAIFDNMGIVELQGDYSIINYVQLAVFGALLVVCLLNYNEYSHKISIRAHKNLDILYWFVISTALSLLVQHGIELDHLLILVVPCSILFSMTMLYLDHRLAEALHFLMVVAILLFQTEGLWGQ
ncbi:MAG: hypothetical protein ACI8YQ_001694 [Polaribacter sp.]